MSWILFLLFSVRRWLVRMLFHKNFLLSMILLCLAIFILTLIQRFGNQSFLRSIPPVHRNNFLDDYIAYPCLPEPWMFSPDSWPTDGKCVRTVNYIESAKHIIPDHKCVYDTTPQGIMVPIVYIQWKGTSGYLGVF